MSYIKIPIARAFALVEVAVAAECYQMVFVECLDVLGDLVGPFGKDGAALAIGFLAAGFVGEFPGEDGGAIFIAIYDIIDVRFEGVDYLAIGVEVGMGELVLAEDIHSVGVHAAVIEPVAAGLFSAGLRDLSKGLT